MILYVQVLRTLLKKILLALPGVPIKAEFITRYKIQDIASCYVGLLPCRMTQRTNLAPSSLPSGMTNLPLSVAFGIERAVVV